MNPCFANKRRLVSGPPGAESGGPGPRCTRLALAVLLALALVGCDGCSVGPLRVDGPSPYVRCIGQAPMDDGKTPFGQVEDGVLELKTGRPLLAAFAAHPEGVDLSKAVAEARAHGADAILVFGPAHPDELGPQGAATGKGAAPVVVIPGGAGEASDWLSFDEPGVFVAGALRGLKAGANLLYLWPGSADGRYAGGEGCGFGPADVAWARKHFGAGAYLAAWTAPANGWVRGVAGVEAGSALVAELERAAQVKGGLYGWPYHAAGQSDARTAAEDEDEGAQGHSTRATRFVVGAGAGPVVRDGAGGGFRSRPLYFRWSEVGFVPEIPEPTAATGDATGPRKGG